jgi:hypothetical protein
MKIKQHIITNKKNISKCSLYTLARRAACTHHHSPTISLARRAASYHHHSPTDLERGRIWSMDLEHGRGRRGFGGREKEEGTRFAEEEGTRFAEARAWSFAEEGTRFAEEEGT